MKGESKILKTLGKMGPAWIIAADACGPATLASLSIAGATYGYKLLWVVLLSVLFGATAQHLSVKIGVIEGRGIITTTEQRLGPVWAWFLTVDAVLVTLLAALVLMNALSGVTSLVTGIQTPYWGFFFAAIICLILIKGGYRWFEILCKGLIVLILTSFLGTLAFVDLTWTEIAGGLMPNLPGGMDSALMMAAIMGGAVHITIIGMHTYNCNAKKWTRSDLRLAKIDNALSMGGAFGLYSILVFLVAAAVLFPNQIKVVTATDAALSLKPLLGSGAMAIFLLGLWGAAFSTLSPTVLAGVYFIMDRMKWPLYDNNRDRRFIWTVIGICLVVAFGPFLRGGFFLLLPLMLALGLCGTPLILAIILYLLNKEEIVGEDKNSRLLNFLGGMTLLVTILLAMRFVAGRLGFFS
ncbi:MAG: divalent metal cation transporter [Desulfuromonadaceae bacterium]|nr:divalent metal cation transporter [Desulfuromonadaceae bacterium]